MTQSYRSAPAKRFAIPEPAWPAPVRRLEQRDYRRLVIEVFLDEEAVNNERLAQFADSVYRAGLRAGRAAALTEMQRAFNAGWTAAERALQGE